MAANTENGNFECNVNDIDKQDLENHENENNRKKEVMLLKVRQQAQLQ